MNETQIESLLRQAPRPPVPANLQRELRATIRLPRTLKSTAASISIAPLWRRWVPALSFGLLFLGCLIVLGMQTHQFLDVRSENEKLRAATANLEQLRRENAELQQLRAASENAERMRRDNEELVRLRAEIAEFRTRAQELTILRAENQRLLTEHAAMLAKAGVAPANDPFAKAKQKAEATRCINNLKQIGLAARMWADGHKTTLLPMDWLTMKNVMPSPKVLTCPGDTVRTKAESWDQFDGSSVSYELPSAAPDERDPYTVYSRCSVHGFVGLTDGSAHLSVKPERFQQVDGNLKLRINATTGAKP